MKILATVLLGPGAESSVADAIASVRDQVDGFVFIESGGGEQALSAAYSALAGDLARTWTHSYTWTGSYADARQHALDAATDAGADWAITLDCDERVTLPDGYRATLEAHPGVDVWIMRGCDHGPCDNQSPGHGYCKERILRTGAGLKWHGRVCENVQSNRQSYIAGHFWENAKTPEGERRRYERGVIECRRMIEEGDDRYKWWRHMGSCYAGLGDMAKSLECYLAALERPHGPEDEARCNYLICEQLVVADRMDEAHDRAAMGLARHAGFIPEFGSILAWVQMKRGDLENASRWAQLVQMVPPDRHRVGHRGKECHQRAQTVLRCIEDHNEALTRPEFVDLRGVRIPVTPRFSANMVRVLVAGEYERAEAEALESLLRPEDRVLDLGAGCGYLSTLAARRLQPSAVLAIEADPDLVAACEATFAANGVDVKLVHAALSDREEPVHLGRARDFWSNRVLAEPSPATVSAPGVTFAIANAHEPTVIVCDIEGSERHLYGYTLPDRIRAVLIETHSDELEAGAVEWLTRYGFARTRKDARASVYERAAA